MHVVYLHVAIKALMILVLDLLDVYKVFNFKEFHSV